MNVFVHLAHGLGGNTHSARYLSGLVPDRVPYDFNLADQMGCRVLVSEDAVESRFTRLMRRGLIAVLGFDLLHAFRNRRAMFQSDIIWTMDERQYLAALCLMGMQKTRRKPIIAQTIWLFDRWSGLSAIRRWYLKKLLRRADILTTHTDNYLEKIVQILPDKSPELLPFGVSATAFPMSEPHENIHLPIRILSAGNDPARDWATLLAAFGNDRRFEVVVLSRKLKSKYANTVSNFQLRRDPSTNDFRSLYRWSDYVVIPMAENLYGGITVALEATRMGSAVVCSATGGVSTYFSEDEALFVSCGSPVEMREAILTCSPDTRLSRIRNAQARCQLEDYSSRGMIKRYVLLSNQILSGRARNLAAF